MSNAYKRIGILGNSSLLRTQKSWVIEFADGSEVKFHNMQLAIKSAKAALSLGMDIHLKEETLMRFKKVGNVNDETSRIDMTERVKLMMRIEK